VSGKHVNARCVHTPVHTRTDAKTRIF
jgi:hypothetical protein